MTKEIPPPSPRTAEHLHPNLKSLTLKSRFRCGDKLFQVTDIGTRTLVAIEIGEKETADPSWVAGPPYAVAEMVFDEDDFPALVPA